MALPPDLPLRAGDVVLVPMTVNYPSDGSGLILGRVGRTSVGIDADEIHSQVFRSFGLGEVVTIDGRLATVRALVDGFVIVTGWNGRPEPIPVPCMDVRTAPSPEADDPDFREVGEDSWPAKFDAAMDEAAARTPERPVISSTDITEGMPIPASTSRVAVVDEDLSSQYRAVERRVPRMPDVVREDDEPEVQF